MKRVLLILTISSAVLVPLKADHSSSRRGYFFLPNRNLYNFRPDLYAFGSPFGLYPPAYHCPPSFYESSYVYRPRFLEPRHRGTYQVVINSPAGMEIIRANTSDLIFNVIPSRALIYVDGKLVGSARDFASERDRFMLIEGTHHLRIEFPGHKPFETEMEIVPNHTLHLDIELERLPQE